MTNPEWWAHAHQAPDSRTEPVTVGQPLWQLSKDVHRAVALVRPIDGVGVELRFEWNGDLRESQVFKTWEALEQRSTEKRAELEARGWR